MEKAINKAYKDGWEGWVNDGYEAINPYKKYSKEWKEWELGWVSGHRAVHTKKGK
jgi:hypothetical protein